MGEAKLRAQRRREAREENTTPDARVKFAYLNHPIPAVLVEQIDLRYPFLASQFETRGEFIAALLQAGIEVCDQDVNAIRKYREGGATPVDPTQPKEERLVLNPDEVPEQAKKVLAAVSPAGYIGRRTPR
jgi:hypothetical protein